MADISILDPAVKAAPKSYVVQGAQEIVLKGVTASFDGTGAGGSWTPAIQVVDPSGFVVGTYTLGQTLAAGVSADVSWFPGVTANAQTLPPVGLVLLASTTLQASATTLDFPGLNQNYSHLMFQGAFRSDVAANTDSVAVQFNGDTGAHYDFQQMVANGPTLSAVAVFGGNNSPFWVCTGANADANHFSSCTGWLHRYSSAVTDHTGHGNSFHVPISGTPSTWQLLYRGIQHCVSPGLPISRVTFLPVTGPHFVAGTTCSVYGVT
jgi:hypothetical protein